MALATIVGAPFPVGNDVALNQWLGNSSAADADGEKLAYVGYPTWHGTDATKTLIGVAFQFGTVEKTGGCTVDVSAQDVADGGNPLLPDETQDQVVTIANADANFASNTWYSATFGTTRTVTRGQPFAVVLEFTPTTGFQAGDSFMLRAINANSPTAISAMKSKLSGAWAAVALTGTLVLIFNDSTYGRLGSNTQPGANGNTGVAFNNASTPDERGNRLVVAAPVGICGIALAASWAGTSSDFDLVLYDTNGTSVLESVSADASKLDNITGHTGGIPFWFDTVVALTASSAYRILLKPTTANNVTVFYATVANAAYLGAWTLGTGLYGTSRTDAGAWTESDTTRYGVYPILTRLDDGAGSGGIARLIGPGGLIG